MSIHPYGADTFLRFQLRNKFRIIKEDDRRVSNSCCEEFTCMKSTLILFSVRFYGKESKV